MGRRGNAERKCASGRPIGGRAVGIHRFAAAWLGACEGRFGDG